MFINEHNFPLRLPELRKSKSLYHNDCQTKAVLEVLSGNLDKLFEFGKCFEVPLKCSIRKLEYWSVQFSLNKILVICTGKIWTAGVVINEIIPIYIYIYNLFKIGYFFSCNSNADFLDISYKLTLSLLNWPTGFSEPWWHWEAAGVLMSYSWGLMGLQPSPPSLMGPGSLYKVSLGLLFSIPWLPVLKGAAGLYWSLTVWCRKGWEEKLSSNNLFPLPAIFMFSFQPVVG